MNLYDAFNQTLASLDHDRHIFCGMTANVDVIIPLRGDDFLNVQRRLSVFPERSDTPPSANLRTPADVVGYVAWFMSRGKGGEANLVGLEPVRPFIDTLPHHRAVGGTGIQAANWLASAGFTKVVLHIPMNDSAFDGLLLNGIRVIDNNAGYSDLIAEDPGFSEVHCIIDYAAGTKVGLGQDIVEAPNDDRVILSGDRCNSRLRISPAFRKEASRAHGQSSLLVTGFNSSRRLDDFHLFVADCAGLMADYRKANGKTGFVHVEDCYQWDHPEVRRRVVASEILPLADSLAMNALEFELEARFFGLDPTDTAGSLLTLAATHGLKRACLHTGAKSCVATRYPVEREINALALAVLFSASRAYYGDFVELARIRELVEKTRHISERAMIPPSRDLGDGYRHVEVPTLYGIPVKSSIGLGDAFSAGLVACL